MATATRPTQQQQLPLWPFVVGMALLGVGLLGGIVIALAFKVSENTPGLISGMPTAMAQQLQFDPNDFGKTLKWSEARAAELNELHRGIELKDLPERNRMRGRQIREEVERVSGQKVHWKMPVLAEPIGDDLFIAVMWPKKHRTWIFGQIAGDREWDRIPFAELPPLPADAQKLIDQRRALDKVQDFWDRGREIGIIWRAFRQWQQKHSLEFFLEFTATIEGSNLDGTKALGYGQEAPVEIYVRLSDFKRISVLP